MSAIERNLIIVHGFPGAGKTTQSRRLENERSGIGHVSIGEIWRGVMSGEISSAHSEEVKSLDITNKQSDDLTNELLFEAIKNLDFFRRTVLVDGYPRYETAIEPFFRMAREQKCRILGGVCLEIDVDSSVDRIVGRGLRPGEEGYAEKGVSDRDKYNNFYLDTYLRTIPVLRKHMSITSIDAAGDVNKVYVDMRCAIDRLMQKSYVS